VVSSHSIKAVEDHAREQVLEQVKKWADFYRYQWLQAKERDDDDVRECCARMIALEDVYRDLKQRNKP